MADKAKKSAPKDEPVERQVRVAAPIEEVFEYFIDADKFIQWQGVTAALDPKPGGIYAVDVFGAGSRCRGEFREVKRPNRIVFTWGWEGENHPIPIGSTTVEVVLEPGEHNTLVKIRHHKVPGPEKQTTGYGWQHYLGRLGLAAAGKDPGPDPWAE